MANPMEQEVSEYMHANIKGIIAQAFQAMWRARPRPSNPSDIKSWLAQYLRSGGTKPAGPANAALDKLAADLRDRHEAAYDAMRRLDRNGDGRLDRAELQRELWGLGAGLSGGEMDAVLREFDSNRDGRVDYQEFYNTMKRHGQAELGQPGDLKEMGRYLTDAIPQAGLNEALETMFDAKPTDCRKWLADYLDRQPTQPAAAADAAPPAAPAEPDVAEMAPLAAPVESATAEKVSPASGGALPAEATVEAAATCKTAGTGVQKEDLPSAVPARVHAHNQFILLPF